MAAAHPSLPADGTNFDPIFKLINSKNKGENWKPTLIAALRSIAANSQHTPQRSFQAGWVDHARCIFCLHSAVSREQFVATMPPLTHALGHGKQHLAPDGPADAYSPGNNSTNASTPSFVSLVSPRPPCCRPGQTSDA